jgi:hypothetical protein
MAEQATTKMSITSDQPNLTLTLGKLSQERSSFLPLAFVDNLQRQARRYAVLEKLKSRREWFFGDLINCQWEKLNDEIKDEVTREGYYVECSYWINAAVGFPIVGASGETLRRWCEVAESFKNVPGIESMKDHLSFDHFRRARVLANKGKVSVPVYALAVAAAEGYTAEEMSRHFDPPASPDEFSRATGWLEGLESAKFEWLPRDKREQAHSLIRQLRQLLS